MVELDVRVFGGGSHCVIHITETGCKNDIAFLLLNHSVDETDRISFRNAFNSHRFQPGQFGFCKKAALIVGIGPAEVSGGADVYKTGFYFFLTAVRSCRGILFSGGKERT